MDFTPLDENSFPREVRKAINRVFAFLNRKWEVRPSEANDIKGARFESSDSRMVLILPRGGFGKSDSDFAFKVYLRKGKDGPEAGVRFDSPLMLSIDHNDTQEVIGELNSDKSDGWRATNDGDLIWIQVLFDTSDWPSVISCEIKNFGEGDDFGGGEVEYVDNNPGGDPNYVQSFLRIPLALIATNIDDALYVEYQYVSGPIMLIDGTYTGKDAGGGNPMNIQAKWRSM